jgi:protein phosphatase 1G
MQGWRKRMEDSHIADLDISKSTHLFGVFDGHGGKEVAQFVKKHFTRELLNNKNYKSANFKKALIETFFKIDEMVLEPQGIQELRELNKISKQEDDAQDKKNPNKQNELYHQLMNKMSNDENIAMFTGCTATVCLIAENKLFFANAGDSRIVIARKGIAYPMTVDHKPDLDSEKNRIYKADGWVAEGRVKGNLNLSRSLGDMEYKSNKKLKPEEQMITAFPDTVEDTTNNVDFIIIGCDGIWDCKTNQEAVDFVSERLRKDPNIRLSSILEELMDQIIAPDLFTGKNIYLTNIKYVNLETGVGCDNMTCTIVQFLKK